MKLAKLHNEPEIFASIQGEGVSAGAPSVFVRLSMCNLHCVWCDTDYTWNWEGTPFAHVRDEEPGYAKHRKSEQVIELSADEVAGRVRELRPRNVVLTGGEPMIQQDELVEVMRGLRETDPSYRFEVETNATMTPGAEFDRLIDQYNTSPKLTNSGVRAALRLKDDALAFFARSAKAWFKFVVCSPDDLNEVDALVVERALPASRVILMPEGTSSDGLDRHGAWLADEAATRGYRYSDRLHVRLWGAERGV